VLAVVTTAMAGSGVGKWGFAVIALMMVSVFARRPASGKFLKLNNALGVTFIILNF
jgi:hypothetical protein